MRRSFFSAVLVTATLVFAQSAGAEVVQENAIRVDFEGKLSPKALPRTGRVPVRVSVGTKIAALNETKPPRLRRISLAINKAGRFSPSALPACTVPDIQPSTTRNALRACGRSLVGTGTFAAKILLPHQVTFPASGTLYAFNGRYRGRPAILAHVYGTNPVPTSFTLPFEIVTRKGELGTVLTASLAGVAGGAGYITELSLDLDRTKGHRGQPFISAGCPAPKGFGLAVFPFAKATLDFAGARISSTLTRACEVRG